MQTPSVSRSNAGEVMPGHKQLLLASQLLGGITDNIDGYMWVLDRSLHYLVLNLQLRNKIKELTGEDITPGQFAIDFIALLDSSKKIAWDEIYKASFKGSPQKLTQQLTIKHKTAFFEIAVNPVKENGKIIAISCFVKDVTEELKTKQKLRTIEKLFHTVADHSTEMIALLNERGFITYSSPAFQKITGFTAGDLLQSNVFITNDATGDHILTKLLQQPGEAFAFPALFRTKNNDVIYTEGIIINELHVPDVNAIVCSFRDVTNRKKAKEALQQSELKFRSLIENSTDIIVMADMDGNITYASPSGKKIFGYDEPDYMGMHACTFIHPDYFLEVAELLQNLHTYPNQLFELELKIFDKAGNERWVQGLASNMLHVKGVNALVGNFRDISERKRAEEALKESKNQYKNLFNKSPLPVCVCDASSLQFLEVNEAAVQVYGYSKKEFLKMTAHEVMAPEERSNLEHLSPNNNRNNRTAVVRKHITKSNETIFVEVLAHSINYKGRDAWLILANDITEKKKLQEMLVQQQQEIARAIIDAQEGERESIGRELHDNICQLLTTARLYLVVAKEQPEIQMDMIQRSNDTINNIIEEIRNLSRSMIETFHKEVGLKFSLDDLIEHITLTNPFKVSLIFSVPDEQQLDDKLKKSVFRIVQEQLNNIVKHANASEVRVSIIQKRQTLIITVADNGKGFDIAMKRKGIGITNIISRAELFNGQVNFNSSPGKGCKMQVSFNV